jgi:Glyoxalase-like domain
MTPGWTTLFLDLTAAGFDPGVAFWRSVTGSGLSAARGVTGGFATLLPPDGDPYLRVQRVDAGPGGVHLDLHLDPDPDGGPERAAAGAVALGAVLRFTEPGLAVLESPGGFGFCLVRREGERTVPAPLTHEGAGTSRADQLCLDVPGQLYERETTFWSALTGWEPRRGSLPAFTSLLRPDGIPVRLLLQRRELSAAGDRVTGHVDLACTDRPALTAVHVEAGAEVVCVNPIWTVLKDPAGRPYCLTDRDPVTGIR